VGSNPTRPRGRARSKQAKDILRQYLYAEYQAKERDRSEKRSELREVFAEALHDHVGSKGEVVALTSSESIEIDRGDVLRDPKIPGYVHPVVRRLILQGPRL
jgi:hypothetical protein